MAAGEIQQQQYILRTEHLSRSIEGEITIQLVDDVSLAIELGQFVCIMGPSGSGKSSLLYLLGLLDLPTAGQIWLAGQHTAQLSDVELAQFRLKNLGYVFQFHFLLSEFSAIDNVALPMRKLGELEHEAILERACSLLTQLGLADQQKKFPHQLSGGQRQRVAIARALANDPKIILADEPTGNLDSASAANVRDILKDLSHSLGKTIISVTHDAQFASVADKIIQIVDGKIKIDT
ncbi:ABC transporter ATP-binding protein [Chitinibacter sp. SCUT-21]|uniref:ABC transporter ATP-binding protein n=1 Tax=Chitinibacter sp. SCUT-21 TaxID=2970891 RepID=UPI0035A627AF